MQIASIFAAAALALPNASATVATPTAVGAPASARAGTATVERVKFTTQDKLTLIADFYPPRKKNAVAPGALLVHDSNGQRADLAEVALRLQKQGFAVLVPDLRGHGDSVQKGQKPWTDLKDAERERMWAFTMRDLRAGADYLQGQKIVHSSNLSLLGYRAGCTLATRHAVRDENVRCVVLLGPKSEQYGFNLRNDVEDLGGLPTYIGVGKDAKSDAELLAEAGSSANGGLDFVQIAIFKGVAPKPIEDKRMPSDVAKWMMDQAVPKKGKSR
jgi:dienelactone hydrolase